MALSRKLISYEYNSVNMETTADLRKFHRFAQIAMTQRSSLHSQV